MLSLKEIFFLTLVLLQTLNSYAQSVKISNLLSELTILTKSHELALQQQNITLSELVKAKHLLDVQHKLPIVKHSQSIFEFSLSNPGEILLLGALTTLGCYFVYTVIVPVVLKNFVNTLESLFFFQTIGETPPPGSVASLPIHDPSINVDIDVVDIDVDLNP